MRIDLHIHFAADAETRHFQEQVLGLLTTLRKDVTDMSEATDRIGSEVAETKTVVDSAIVLINGMAQQIRDLADDPAALNAFADELDAKTNELAAKVQENTPAPPAP